MPFSGGTRFFGGCGRTSEKERSAAAALTVGATGFITQENEKGKGPMLVKTFVQKYKFCNKNTLIRYLIDF